MVEERSLAQGKGAFRRAEVQGLCMVCGEDAAQARCPRCGGPLCEIHAVSGDQRCAACEEALAAVRHDRKVNPVPNYTLPVALFASLSVVTFTIWLTQGRPWIVFAAAIVAALFPLFFALYRRRRVLPLFLRETPTKRYLKLPPARLEDEEVAAPPLDSTTRTVFALSLLCPLPYLPIAAIVLALMVLARRGEQHPGSRSYAVCALMICVPMAIFQLVMTVRLLQVFWG